jgi:hypothetical protein
MKRKRENMEEKGRGRELGRGREQGRERERK